MRTSSGLESIRFEQPFLHIVLQEYIDAARAATRRVNGLTDQLQPVLPDWSLAPVLHGLVARFGQISRFCRISHAQNFNRRSVQSSSNWQPLSLWNFDIADIVR